MTVKDIATVLQYTDEDALITIKRIGEILPEEQTANMLLKDENSKYHDLEVHLITVKNNPLFNGETNKVITLVV